MSNFCNYIEQLSVMYGALREISRVLHFKLNKPENKYFKHLFIREAVKALKGKRNFDDYFNERDKISKMISEAEKKHSDRDKCKPYATCCQCKSKIPRTSPIEIDSDGNVFCSSSCCRRFYRFKTIWPTDKEYNEFTSYTEK
ncbi:MAG: hypothetical protein IJ165_07190 [Proteobacteria bacterium]|nr:hypothetical protein [Pseudomonadota bacterium]